ncbi:hypothetical protein Bbelb_398050 [Branchiostoma belcheri]|nr:hypothetical protein Bbelb_398050 [Branchiostoma belcheri]
MYLRRRALRRRRVGRRRERYHEIQRAAIFAVIAIIQAQGGIDREVLANAVRTISRVYTRRGGILTPRWAIVHDRTPAFEVSYAMPIPTPGLQKEFTGKLRQVHPEMQTTAGIHDAKLWKDRGVHASFSRKKNKH